MFLGVVAIGTLGRDTVLHVVVVTFGVGVWMTGAAGALAIGVGGVDCELQIGFAGTVRGRGGGGRGARCGNPSGARRFVASFATMVAS